MFCFHKWKIIKEETVVLTYPNNIKKDVLRFTLQCLKCGDVKGRVIKD